jgi:hypothetical protein
MRIRRKDKKSPKRDDIANRRMVKAVAPPSAPSIEEDSINTANLTSDGEQDTASMHFVPESKIVQNEVLKEKTEKWRQDRLDATAANRKEKKEKEVLEHRRKMSVGGQEGEEAQYSERVDAEPVPSILSVTPKFPEHKRKLSRDDHAEKKSRVEEDEESEKAITVRVTKGFGWVKTAAPVAIVAFTAVVAFTLLRKRR